MIALVSTLLNVSSVWWIFSSHAAAPTDPRPLSELSYASAYIGLENAYRDPTTPPLPPVVNYPTRVATVDSLRQGKTYVDVPQLSSTYGMFYPERQQALVSAHVRPRPDLPLVH